MGEKYWPKQVPIKGDPVWDATRDPAQGLQPNGVIIRTFVENKRVTEIVVKFHDNVRTRKTVVTYPYADFQGCYTGPTTGWMIKQEYDDEPWVEDIVI